ncbi:MAG: 2,6-dioxo-6-phenylhexa-3-enoate hydrolase [Chloroflexota bacterium]|nr:MAG: 2,6-dioxo-6-phenylhexa-3-enoate hydrolase [Chloroflexota bacterium]
MAAENKTATIKTAGGATFLNRAGAGKDEAVLFLHGSGPGATGWSNWQYALPALGEHFDCLAPDLIGFGESDHPNPPPTRIQEWMRRWVDQQLALLDELKLDKVHLVGNSMGGAIALPLLLAAPQRFDKVVLMGAIGAPCRLTPGLDRLWGFYNDPSPRTMAQVITWFVHDVGIVSSRLEAIAQARFEAAMQPEVRRSFEAMFPAPRQKVLDELVVPDLALSRMHQPMLLVHGRDDAIVSLETSLYLAQRLPNVQLHVYGQCSHWVQVERSQSFHRLLLDFFTGQM